MAWIPRAHWDSGTGTLYCHPALYTEQPRYSSRSQEGLIWAHSCKNCFPTLFPKAKNISCSLKNAFVYDTSSNLQDIHLSLLHCGQILYRLSHQGSLILCKFPHILSVGLYCFSRELCVFDRFLCCKLKKRT